MSEQAKPTCPFCGASVKPDWTGSIYWFDCGTMNNANDMSDRHDQTAICAQAERDRMAKELEAAKRESHELSLELAKSQHRVSTLELQIREDSKGLKAQDERIRRLEEAGDAMAEYLGSVGSGGWTKAKEAKP
jgi:predicted  nucleic acid-binding Zn-ribbon protein